MTLVLQIGVLQVGDPASGQASQPTTATTQPSVITIVGGPNATANIPGSYSDPADLYGIVLALIAIGLAIVATRWLFGRGRGRRGPKDGQAEASR